MINYGYIYGGWKRKIYHKHTERKSHTEFQVSFKTKLQNKRINGKVATML